ncbi:GntR family transcriptional regulator [Streptomyces sp. B1866]|uniref:GntR family transcriptional regulator n=1 Tax=Streptomyces sp. B1866 TaxID=3075431 RepID=UPI0028911902|nr:GntR family transcriptional regulator [Streptomyces sp. B1866]MDT3396452.1 GntR family transcriptional regulator [Streptomyces sp. B1866]
MTQHEDARKSKYQRIADDLKADIQAGKHAPGARLPGENELMAKYGVARMTVRHALSVLQSEGLVKARKGAGVFVSPFAVTGADRLSRLERTGRAYAQGESSADHVAIRRSCGDADIAEQLGIELFDEIVVRRRTFRQDGKPSVVALSCIHLRAAAVVPEVLQQGQLIPFWQSTYTERTGKKITRGPERRSARLASSDELAALEIHVPPHAAVPVLVLHTAFYDPDGPIEVWEDVYAPGLWQVASE